MLQFILRHAIFFLSQIRFGCTYVIHKYPERYGVISAALHWLSAIIVYGMFALGLWMVTLSYYDGWYHQAPELHKSIGILLMMGLVIRVLWRVISPPPGPLPSYSPMTRLAAKAGHLALYLLLFAIGISGYLISTADGKPISVFGWFDVPATLSDAGAQADFAGALHLARVERCSTVRYARIYGPEASFHR